MSSTISAIITTFNYERFLPAAIESVLGQTVTPDEVLIVDDGSTDRTAEIAFTYSERGVRYIYTENGGAGSARNVGLRETNCDLVAFLDADDRWVPNKLALQVEHLRCYPQAGLVSGGECHVHESGNDDPFFLRRKPEGAANFYPRILVENIIGNPSLTLVRRACFDRVGLFDETLRLGQDWDMWIRMTRAYLVGVVDAPLIYYMRHPSSLTAGQFWKRYVTNRTIQRRYIARVMPKRERLRLLLAAQSMNCYYAAAAFVDDGQHRLSALALSLAAMLLNPTYETRMKAGVLFRALFGRVAFDRLSHAVRRFS